MIANVAAGSDQAIALGRGGMTSVQCNFILLATVLSSSLVFFDGAGINIALPAMGKGLRVDGLSLQWVVTAYLLPMSAFQLFAGALGDRFNRRSVLISGISIFTGASLLCAAAPGYGILLFARALQGIGAALIMPNSLAVLGAAYDGSGRGRAVGIWTAVGAIASAFGPPLAGWLVDEFSWRLVFLMNVPLGLITLALALYKVPSSRDVQIPLDVPGTLVAALGLFCLTWAIAHFAGDRSTGEVLLFGSVSAIAFIVLGILEWRRGERAMIPISMFTSRVFLGLNLFTVLVYATFGALFVVLPVVLLAQGNLSATGVGFAILPLPVVLGVASSVAGRYARVFGIRQMLAVGALLCGVGYWTLSLVENGSYWSHFFPAMTLIAIGMAIILAPLTTAVLSSVDLPHAATAAGFNSTISRVGSLVAVAASGAVLSGTPSTIQTAFHHASSIAALFSALASIVILIALPPIA